MQITYSECKSIEIRFLNIISETEVKREISRNTFSTHDNHGLFQLQVSHDLVALKQWLDANRLSLDVIKTECMFIRTDILVSTDIKSKELQLINVLESI